MEKKNFLSVLEENYEASKRMVDEDKARPAQEIVMETYEDLISIYNANFKENNGDAENLFPFEQCGNLKEKERYPEFTPLVTHLTRMVASEAESIIPSIQSDMPYKMQFVLEEVIKKLQILV